MFLVRLALGLGAAVLVLPTDAQQQAKLYGTAAATLERAVTFCDRNPVTCKTGAEAWATFVRKAEFGGRMALDLFNERQRLQETAALPAPGIATTRVRTEPVMVNSRGTLRPADVAPVWRGPAQRSGA